MKLTVLPRSENDVVYVQCQGRISSPRSKEESAPVDTLLQGNCFWRNILLNLEMADDIDTSGISWIMSKHSQLKQLGGKLILYGVPEMVSRVIDVLKLGPNLFIAPNEAAAREMALRDRPPAELSQMNSPAPVSKENYTIAGNTDPDSNNVFFQP
jgi:anti-anti-sigma factor